MTIVLIIVLALAFAAVLACAFRFAGRARKAERALVEAEGDWRRLLDISIDNVVLSDLADGTIYDVSESFSRTTGYGREEVIGKTSLEMGFWVDAAERDLFANLLATQGGLRNERVQFRMKSGEIRTMVFSAQTCTHKGRACVLGTAIDMTERERIEMDLRKSKEQYQELVDSLPLAIFEVDPTGRLTFGSRNAFAMFGYSAEDFPDGLNVLESIAPEDHERARRNMTARLQGRPSAPNEYTAVRKDGSTFPIMLHSNPIVRDGSVAGLRGYILDISERKQAECALAASEEKYRSLFDESKDVVFFSTLEGRFLDINPAGLQLFRYGSKQEMLSREMGKDFFVVPGTQDRYTARLLQDGFVKDYEMSLRRKDGAIATVLVTSSVVLDGRGTVTGVKGVMRDITEHKLLEAQLLQAQKMEAVGQLAGGIAHDFNNILTTIMGYGDLLARRVTGDEVSSRYLSELLSSAERAASLTQRLLAFSRKQVLHMQPVDVNAVVRRVEDLLSRTIGEDIELKIATTGDRLEIMGDSSQIEQILMNLATNARDAMPQGGSLTIETLLRHVSDELVNTYGVLRPGHYAVITVADTGMGMDEAVQGRIFEPFFTTKEVGKGTGLGLAMTYGIVRQLEGTILVTSSPDRGSAFSIYLPVIEAPARTAQTREAVDETAAWAARDAETVLVAEDSDHVRKLLRLILERAGYRVIDAADGEEAIEAFRENADAVSLVVLDLIMPKMSGRQVYEEMKRISPRVKIVLTSGYSADVAYEKGVLGEDAPSMLIKPVSPKVLLKKVRELLDS